MKLSRRNREALAREQARQTTKPPAVSKYAAKRRPALLRDPETADNARAALTGSETR